jgi:MFS family permease
MLCYVVAYLDRVNVGFAKLQMLEDLGFSDTIYGLGAGLFFIGYFIFEVPSNVILYRVGARIWIGRIMITWGLISAAFVFVSSPAVFYAMRFLPDVLVPQRSASPRHHGVHDGHSDFRHLRRPAVGLDHVVDGRIRGLERLAVDVPD